MRRSKSGCPFSSPRYKSHAVELRHPQITEDQVQRAQSDLLERLTAIASRLDLVALSGQRFGHELRNQRLVVDHENDWTVGLLGCHRDRGRLSPPRDEETQAGGHQRRVGKFAPYGA